jgi:hypothetical protein
VALTVRAVVNLDFPARDPHLLTASGEVRGRCAWPDEMVPAMLAGLVGNAEFCNAHDGGKGDVGQDALQSVVLLWGEQDVVVEDVA